MRVCFITLLCLFLLYSLFFLNILLIMNFDTPIICDMIVNKVMFSSVQFNMDAVNPLFINDCIKTYPIEGLKLTDEVYQLANHRLKIG